MIEANLEDSKVRTRTLIMYKTDNHQRKKKEKKGKLNQLTWPYNVKYVPTVEKS